MLSASGFCSCLLMVAGWIGPPKASAEELAAPEYKVKAAFLYNFAKLTEWPSNAFTNASGPILIGVLGKDPFGPVLAEVTKNRTVGSRAIEIVRFERVDQVKNCHLLFISASEGPRLTSILSRLAGKPILTVGDTTQIARQGTVIGFIKSGDEIRFEVNLDAAAAARLKLSSKLLRLAEIVRPNIDRRKD